MTPSFENSCCSECGALNPRPSSYWTPQNHRRSSHYQRSPRRRSSDRHLHLAPEPRPLQRPPEMVQSMIYSRHKQHQYYSPQLRRKSADYSHAMLQFQQEIPTSDSSDEDQPVESQCHTAEHLSENR